MSDKITGIILAKGKSSRMGTDKYKLLDLLKKVDVKFVDFANRNLFKNFNTFSDIIQSLSDVKLSMTNLILIAGNGRNVGKTFLACQIIKYLSKFNQVIGVKISPHFHQTDEENLIIKNEKFIIIEEKSTTTKDSSLMLQAGAKKVFYIMAKQENLKEAFTFVNEKLNDYPVVCESGGLHEFVQPGLFLFVKNKVDLVQKKDLLKYAPIIVTNHQKKFDFNEQCIGYKNHQITINNLMHRQV